MNRLLFLLFIASGLATQAAWTAGESSTIVGAGNEFLSAGAFAMRTGDYAEGIRLTNLGLTRYAPSLDDRAKALSNLCAAHAAIDEPDIAITHCSESLQLVGRNWRAYANRAYAYILKGMYSEATFDIDAAASINPDAKNVADLRAMLNERGLSPHVIIQDHR